MVISLPLSCTQQTCGQGVGHIGATPGAPPTMTSSRDEGGSLRQSADSPSMALQDNWLPRRQRVAAT